MGKEASRPTLVYLHIPKCAGSSMMGLLRSNYGAGFFRVPNGGGWRRFSQLNAGFREGITCLTGHMPWGLGRYIPGAVRYAVMLRHPVDRVASLYWFCRSFKKHRWHKAAMHCDLATFVASRAFSDLDNGMTRWLAGRRDVGSLKIKRDLDEDDLTLAMTHVKASLIGFVRSFGQCVHNLSLELGWKHTAHGHQVQGMYPGPDPKERRLIERANAFDMALYEYALKMG